MTRISKRAAMALAVVCTVAGISAASAMADASQGIATRSLSASETANGTTYTYSGSCRFSPGASTAPGQPIDYAVEVDGSAMSSDATNPTLATGVVCQISYVGGPVVKRIGIGLPGSTAVTADTVALDPTRAVEVCVSVNGGFLNGFGGGTAPCS